MRSKWFQLHYLFLTIKSLFVPMDQSAMDQSAMDQSTVDQPQIQFDQISVPSNELIVWDYDIEESEKEANKAYKEQKRLLKIALEERIARGRAIKEKIKEELLLGTDGQ
jgi:hypothetical protein